MENFNLKKFLTENKLTKNSKILKESVLFKGKPVAIDSIEIEDVFRDDYPDFSDAYISYAEYEDGTPLTEDELQEFQDDQYGLVGELIHDRQLYLENKPVKENQQRDEEYYANLEQEEIVMEIAKDAIALIDEQPGTSAIMALEAIIEQMEDLLPENRPVNENVKTTKKNILK